jgi:hypothetical protein
LQVRVDGSTRVVDLDAGESSAVIREAVGCQWFEHVAVTDGLSVWVDEEGLLNGLRPNVFASALAIAAGGPAHLYVGDALFTAGAEDGELLGLTEDQVEALRSWLSAAPVSP